MTAMAGREPGLVFVGSCFALAQLFLLGEQAVAHGDAIEDRIEHKPAHSTALMPCRLAYFLRLFLRAAYENSGFLDAWHNSPLGFGILG